jgi:phosphopantothenate-cysteine ligase/phosphopantothenoylcysteine decarboxylase/phosphopantothenate--cysteine ligase
MKLLVTAGNTQTPIDRVRCLTNIFTGRTGSQIAHAAAARGHAVTLFTSHPEIMRELAAPHAPAPWHVENYRTFEELHYLMAAAVGRDEFDAIVHAAAVGDYHLEGTYVPVAGTSFDVEHGAWHGTNPRLANVSAGKVKSSHPELWLRLTPTPKLVDLIRQPWGFKGILVKFKLEVGLSRDELLAVAENSRQQSAADLMVANTLEDRHDEAFIGAVDYARVARTQLATTLLDRIEALSHR